MTVSVLIMILPVEYCLQFEYCSFEEHVPLSCYGNSIAVQYCKFGVRSGIRCYNVSKTTIQYSSLDESYIGVSNAAVIQYNDINGGNEEAGGIWVDTGTYTIRFNNIINTTEHAISNGNYYADTIYLYVDNNYIANCNGLIGVDTDGSQSEGVVYNSYRTTPVEEAGCGW